MAGGYSSGGAPEIIQRLNKAATIAE